MRSMLLTLVGATVALGLASCKPSSLPAQRYLQVIDILEVRKGISPELKSELSRRIGVGMDSKSKEPFDAVVVDWLPSDCQLLSPEIGTLQIAALDGKNRPVEFTSTKKSDCTDLRMGFSGLPSLPQGKACCACDGQCGRACSIEFRYRTSFSGNALRWGDLQCTITPTTLQAGKKSTVRIAVEARDVSMRDNTVVICIPKADINGAKFSIRGHSAKLRTVRSGSSTVRLATKKGQGAGRHTVDLVVIPSHTGAIPLKKIAELAGKLDKPVRAPASLADAGGKAKPDHQTYVKIAHDMQLTVR